MYQDVIGFLARYPVYEDTLTDVAISSDGSSFVVDSQSGLSLSVNLTTGIISVNANGAIGQGVLTPYFKSVAGKELIAARAYTLSTATNLAFEGDPVYQYSKSSAWQLEEDCGGCGY